MKKKKKKKKKKKHSMRSSFMIFNLHMSRTIAFPTRLYLRPAKTQTSLSIRVDCSESSNCTLWMANDPKRVQAHRKDSDQTARMRRLI